MNLDDLTDARKRHSALPAEWQREAFVDELDRVETVAARRERLAAALSEASAALLTELLSDPVDVDAAVICHQRKTALGELLEDTPPAELSYESLLPLAIDVHNRLGGVIPGDAHALPALSYLKDVEAHRVFGGHNSDAEVPVRTVEDAAAQKAIDAASERFTSWATSLQLFASHTDVDLLAWLVGVASVTAEIDSQAQSLLDEVRALITKANDARVEQGLSFRSSSSNDDVRSAGPRATDLCPPLLARSSFASSPLSAMSTGVAVPAPSPFN